MKVLRPSKGKMTCDPICHGYKAYDFVGNIYAPISGKVVLRSDGEGRNWQVGKANDPYRSTRNGRLLTADYGNYFKLKGDNCFWLVAHLPIGVVPKIGEELRAGQFVSAAGSTGNSTAAHAHHEFRGLNGVNIEVEFEDIPPPQEERRSTQMNDQTKIPASFLGWDQDLEIQQIRGLLGDLKRAQKLMEEAQGAIGTLKIERDDALNKLADYAKYQPLIELLKKLFG